MINLKNEIPMARMLQQIPRDCMDFLIFRTYGDMTRLGIGTLIELTVRSKIRDDRTLHLIKDSIRTQLSQIAPITF